MPRPKKDPDAVLIRELRITPPDGLPITDWKITQGDFKMLLACEEGGVEDVRLHYHCYIETLRSESWLKKWIYSIAHCYNGEQGNSVFFSRKPHDHTIGYVVKYGNVVCRHGCEETFITEWLAKSEQYRTNKDTERKRKHRVEKAFTQQVRETISRTLRESPDLRTIGQVMNLILAQYDEHKKMYPTRTSMETQIVTLLAPYDDSLVRAFYLRAFEYR